MTKRTFLLTVITTVLVTIIAMGLGLGLGLVWMGYMRLKASPSTMLRLSVPQLGGVPFKMWPIKNFEDTFGFNPDEKQSSLATNIKLTEFGDVMMADGNLKLSIPGQDSYTFNLGTDQVMMKPVAIEGETYGFGIVKGTVKTRDGEKSFRATITHNAAKSKVEVFLEIEDIAALRFGKEVDGLSEIRREIWDKGLLPRQYYPT